MNIIENISILTNYTLKVEFKNGEIKYFDVKPYIDAEESVFHELKNETIFKLIKNHGYYVEWPNEIDISSDTIYYDGVPQIKE